jgi:hypothetical protein
VWDKTVQYTDFKRLSEEELAKFCSPGLLELGLIESLL